MAIQPIDLQTMYSQMANVAQTVARAQEGPQLTEAMQQQNVVQKNKELADKVHRAADGDEKSPVIKDEGQSGTTGNSAGRKRQKQNKTETDEKSEDDGIRESYLGQHINITR
ncbi:MAG: hypothetical protein M0P01_11430 [Treponema sp.]|nr:hypothetical protein [Treponema sp.]